MNQPILSTTTISETTTTVDNFPADYGSTSHRCEVRINDGPSQTVDARNAEGKPVITHQPGDSLRVKVIAATLTEVESPEAVYPA